MRGSSRVMLVHWNRAEAEARKPRLRGYDVELVCDPRNAASPLRDLKRRPPKAIVVDLTRLPSQGRDLALALRESKRTAQIPVVFVEGDEKKVKRLVELLPDATFTSWSRIRSALKRAIASPPESPVARNRMSGYSHKSPAEKLGIRPGSMVAMPGAPKEAVARIGVPRRLRGRRDLTLWFVRSRAELEERIARMSDYAANGGLWILWPKKASKVASDLSPAVVRRTAESAGLVDFKILSLDDTWSGLRFTRRR